MKDIQQEFASLLAFIESYSETIDKNKLKKAWEFAKISHSGQKRKSGEPYIIHPLNVAKILASWKLDETSIIAGLLHDTIEDSSTKKSDLCNAFGEDVCRLVDGVTKVTELRLKDEMRLQSVENLRKLILVLMRDLRVVLIKLADRLHNMRTLEYLSVEKQQENARETLEIYAPLADRMGMGEVKGALEDLSFKFLFPSEYKTLVSDSKKMYKNAEEHIKKMQQIILSGLEGRGVDSEVDGRKKHYYSLWKKLQRNEIEGDYSKIYDVVALRILVDTKEECYTALGVVHGNYKPVPHLGISDFIAQPKPNGYQSIHTKVFGPSSRIVEVQIRTYDMHNQAEFGAAAHWNMSELKASGKVTSEDIDSGEKLIAKNEKIKWVKELVRWQDELQGSDEFMKAVKFDALSNRQFVFSPNGDVYDLPVDATPVDFAAAVHTDLVDYIKSAKVNGRIVPLLSHLKSGDVVEIEKIKQKKKPNEDWLRNVKTTEAKRAIAKSLGIKR